MVKIISDYGYCFGVEHAIQILLDGQNRKGKVYLTHPLLHNKLENEKMMKSVSASFLTKDVCLKKEDQVILSAHGHTIEEERFLENKCVLKDATCPLILKRYQQIPPFEDGVSYLYLGKERHQETLGFLSHFPYFKFIDSALDGKEQLDGIPLLEKSVVIPQTTVSPNKLAALLSEVSKRSEVIFSLPICPFYGRRGKEASQFIKDLCPKKNAFLVCGDTSSSNAREIFSQMRNANKELFGQICLSIYDLNLSDFQNKNIYIASATSVSKETVLKLKADLIDKFGDVEY